MSTYLHLPPHLWPEHERYTRWGLTSLLLERPDDADLWAIEQATSPADLLTRLAAAQASKAEIAGGIAAYQRRVRDEMAQLLADMQAAESEVAAEAQEASKAVASQGTPEAKAAPKAKGKAA